MDSKKLTAAVSGSIAFLQWAVPELEKRVKGGEVSAPKQAQLLAELGALTALRDKTSAEYTVPENELSGR